MVAMKILIIGSGGREHSLAWKISQSKKCSELYILPGNAGTSTCGTNVPIQVSETEKIKNFCTEHAIDLVVVGPEGPLVEGITDALKSGPQPVPGIIGPSAFASQLEGSKAFAKKFMQQYQIPTAAYIEVTKENLDEGFRFLESLKPPFVLKADGLAAGKGVLIINDIAEAKKELHSMISGKFGNASATVVIEAFLSGIEFSAFALTDGRNYVMLPEAKDYKRIGEGDTGLNTGGMGAVSPVPFVDQVLWEKVMTRIVEPTIAGIANENMDYTGFVFFGLINVGGDPFVIEYNCRLGDPETEVIIPRIENDLVDVFTAAIDGKLSELTLQFSSNAAVTVMMVSGGYPGDFEKNKTISALDTVKDSIVFHSGTIQKDGEVLTQGGRVLAITTLHTNFQEAVNISLKNANQIQFEGKYFRKDIGFDL